MGSTSHLFPKQSNSNGGAVRPGTGEFLRRRSLSVLFVSREAEIVNSCIQAFAEARFKVTCDVALNMAAGEKQLRARSYDVIVAEYPSLRSKGPQISQLCEHAAQDIPVILLVSRMATESVASLEAAGVFECVGREHLAQLPMAVRRALNQKKLRAELAGAERALRHLQSLYRAVLENPCYGICRCDAEGKLLEVNQALATMLGYESPEELLQANGSTGVFIHIREGGQVAKTAPGSMRIGPIELEWRRKDGMILRTVVSARDAYDEQGDFNGCEIIVADITEQRILEDQLRRQAATDSLTNLANHRHLFDVLQAEIDRSNRTGRVFSLVLLDLDGLKKINDQYGHATGDRALCRLAQILGDCCRSVDTAARHGGDEFALVLPETTVAEATLVTKRICELLGLEDEKPAISVSVGTASFPEDGNTIGTLVCAADRALYAMKDIRPCSSGSALVGSSPQTELDEVHVKRAAGTKTTGSRD